MLQERKTEVKMHRSPIDPIQILASSSLMPRRCISLPANDLQQERNPKYPVAPPHNQETPAASRLVKNVLFVTDSASLECYT
jgi:hypothetical protein